MLALFYLKNTSKITNKYAIKIIGSEYINLGFLVLCLKTIIPKRPPKTPPKIQKVNNVFSLILYALCLALSLSTPKIIKVKTFIIIK